MKMAISNQIVKSYSRLETQTIYIYRDTISHIKDEHRAVTYLELYKLSKALHKPIETFSYIAHFV